MNTDPPVNAQQITIQPARSSGDNSSTEYLSSSIKRLTDEANWWEKWYLKLGAALVILTAVVGGSAAYFQYIAVKKARDLADTEAELSRAKERQLNVDLQDKDLRIAELNRQAGELNKLAGDALERAGNADKSAGEANKEAGRANERAATVERKNLELTKSIAETMKALQPRDLPMVAFGEKMRQFAGTKAIVETIPDWEAAKTSELIASSLRSGGWVVPEVVVRIDLKTALSDFFRSGVVVQISLPDLDHANSLPREERSAYLNRYREFRNVQPALIKELNVVGIVATSHAVDDTIPPETIRIRVSAKPIPGEMGAERGNKIFIAPGVVIPPGFIKIEPDAPKPPPKKQEE